MVVFLSWEEEMQFFFKLIWNLKQDKVTQNVSGTKFCKYSRLKHMLLYLALASLEKKVQRPWNKDEVLVFWM
jgi:hypothetical protein